MTWLIRGESGGSTGPTGPAGEDGATGATGATGADGNFGGATFEYTFNNATTGSTLQGELGFNNASPASTTLIRIDDEDVNGTDIQPFLRTIDDSTSSIKGHVRISNKTDASDFALFTIDGTNTEESAYHEVTVNHVSGSASSFANAEELICTFARIGDKGDTGQGVDAGGTTGQHLIKTSDTDYDVEWSEVDGGGHAVIDESGSALTQRDNLTLIGELVTATDNGSTSTDVTIDAKTSWLYG
jgi:hypothetical protein